MAIIEVVETYCQLAVGQMDVYLSGVANRQDKVMKVLTITASMFFPLTLLAGIYGVNIENTPELHSTRGYPLLLAITVVVGAGMAVDFKGNGWLGNK